MAGGATRALGGLSFDRVVREEEGLLPIGGTALSLRLKIVETGKNDREDNQPSARREKKRGSDSYERLLLFLESRVVSLNDITVHHAWFAEKHPFQLLESTEKNSEKSRACHDSNTPCDQQEKTD